MDYGFTAKIENEFDEIAEGDQDWSKMLKDFYSPFKKDVDHTMEKPNASAVNENWEMILSQVKE